MNNDTSFDFLKKKVFASSIYIKDKMKENKMKENQKKDFALKNKITVSSTPSSSKFGFALAKENYILLAIGFGIIIIGFLLMMGGATENPNEFHPEELFSFRRVTLAPLVVLGGFVFEIYAIMKKPKDI